MGFGFRVIKEVLHFWFLNSCYLVIHSFPITHVKALDQEGYGALASMCSLQGWALYRLKPKIHMQMHLQKLCSREVVLSFVRFYICPQNYNKSANLPGYLSIPSNPRPETQNNVRREMDLQSHRGEYCVNMLSGFAQAARFYMCVLAWDSWVNLGYSCLSDEDYIGKVARISRRQSTAKVAIRCIRVCLLLYKQLWSREVLR